MGMAPNILFVIHMNPVARRDYVRRRNAAFRFEMRFPKSELVKRARSLKVKVAKDMTKEQIIKKMIKWVD